MKKYNLFSFLSFAITIYLCARTSADAQPICFSSPNLHFTGGGETYGAVAADFNHDSLVDLVTANATTDNISIMLGDGNGSFSAATNYSTGSVSNGICNGDFNNDGNMDVAVANQGAVTHDISVLLGNGDGTFNNAISIPIVGYVPYQVISYDFDNDTLLDLAVVSSGTNVIIMKGDGAGNFSVLNSYPTSAWYGSISLADIDNDGIQDIALPGGFGYNLVFLRGLGGGSFAAPLSLPCNERPFFVMATDLNNDSLPEVIAANSLDTTITVFFNNGNFSFAAPVYYAFAGPSFLSPGSVSFADFNGDNIPDMLVAFGTLNGVSVLPGTGNGNFSGEQHFLGASGSAVALAADLNQDNKTDVIHPSDGGNSYYVLLNCTPSGIVEATGEMAGIKIYPTLVSDFFTIALSHINLESARAEISVYDEAGRMVLNYPGESFQQTSTNNYTIQLSRPPVSAGNYYINISISALQNERRRMLHGKIIVI